MHDALTNAHHCAVALYATAQRWTNTHTRDVAPVQQPNGGAIKSRHAMLKTEFMVDLEADLSPGERAVLWAKVTADHTAWVAKQSKPRGNGGGE